MTRHQLTWQINASWIWFGVQVFVFSHISNGQVLTNTDHLIVNSGSCSPNYYTNPICIDHPGGYGCECGPGFYWNTQKCISYAIDSRFEFKSGEPIRYAILLGKAFPKLMAFTISFWINVNDPMHAGTILSYKHGNQANLLRMMSGPTLNFEISGKLHVTDIELLKDKWYHIALTWNSTTGVWGLYINGLPTPGGVIRGSQGFPSGGEFVLGQSSRPDVVFNSSRALDGDLSHLNIWNFVMSPDEIKRINNSCNFMYCGNAVQWVEFRSGTRGAMKMRWPSGIFTGQCFTGQYSAISCDKFCSVLIGAQCNEETKENIKWTRQRAQQNVTVPCPMLPSEGRNATATRFATRTCDLDTSDNDGVWREPFIDDCVSGDLLELKRAFLDLESGAINEVEVFKLADRLLNHSRENVYMNPIDIATVIDMFAILVKSQDIAPRTVTWRDSGKMYATVSEVYPTFIQTETFSELLINIVNNLLAPRNEAGWNATVPPGAEGDQLLKVLHDFADVISRSLDYHIRDGLIDFRHAKIVIIRKFVEFKIETQWVYEVQGLEFPDSRMLGEDGRPAREYGFVKLTKEAIMATNATSLTVFMGISTFRYKTLSRILPTQNISSRHKEDRVNSPIIALYFHMQPNTDTTSVDLGNLSSPIFVHLPLLDTFNISNPNCVRLRHGLGRREWKWHRNICSLVQYTRQAGICACSRPGIFAITTDMYDDNWDKGDKRPNLLNFASYFGCTMSATLCFMVCGVHVYLRTSTSTAAIHRNLSVSIALSHIVFMFGIDRNDTPALCHVFAILLHYFFLATYSWLMNEAFNLYIVITYSTHNPSDLNDSGSMIRYYVLGWVLPAVMVGAFAGTSEDYYATDLRFFQHDYVLQSYSFLHYKKPWNRYGKCFVATTFFLCIIFRCWIAPDHVWLFIGPAIGIISVTILVLIFTAKEHNENSYTKSDNTNKIINIHMKALWTQVILVTVCWAFAFISIKMVDTIIKYLYAMFTSLQGAFFLVFYMFLHEEVRAWIKSRQKRRALQLQGFECQDSLDSFASNSVLDRDGMDGYNGGTNTMGRGSGSYNLSVTRCSYGQNGGGPSSDRGVNHLRRAPRPPRLRELSRQGNISGSVGKSQERSDCEIVSSV